MTTREMPSLAQMSIHVDGAPLAGQYMFNLLELEVDMSFDVPDMFTLRFSDPELELMDSSIFDLGKQVKISTGDPNSRSASTVLIEGEVTALEPEFTEATVPVMVVRGFEKSHRLYMGTKTRTFMNVTYSDIAQQMAGEHGLSAQVTSSTHVYEQLWQDNRSDYAFLVDLARMEGHEIYADGSKLVSKKPSSTSVDVTLTWGANLLSFRPSIRSVGQVKKVIVRGWEQKQKQEVVGQATSSTSHPSIGYNKAGTQAPAIFSSEAALELTRYDVDTASEANKLAQSILDEINGRFVEAEGEAPGVPALRAGITVKVEHVGTKFGGNYRVTTATHTYNMVDGYRVYFRVEGPRVRMLTDLLSGGSGTASAAGESSTWYGVMPAIVTDNNPPEIDGSVKVKFPYLTDEHQSAWARVVSDGAGNEYGNLFLPEVGDEVLVAFENGSIDRPYVLGGLWNGRDKPPLPTTAAVSGGKVVKRIIQSRGGHIIELDDTQGQEKITIVDGKGGTTITFDAAQKDISINCGNNVTIKSTGNMTFEATGNIEMKATGNMTLKSTGPLEAKTDATGTLQAGAPLTIKGAVVNIN